MSSKDGKGAATSAVSFGIDAERLFGFLDKDDGLRNVRDAGGVEAVGRHVKTDLSLGRTDTAQVTEARRAVFGANVLPEEEAVSFFGLLLEALGDQMMLLLIGSAVVSLVLGLTVPNAETGKVDWEHGWIEGTAILVSVMIVSVVTSVNNYQKELKFKELAAAAAPGNVTVIRRGEREEVAENELLVGDLLCVVAGLVCPVDALVVRSVGVKMDESTATGENDEIEKSAQGDMVLRSGTFVLEGEGIALVIGVGEKSMAGRLTMATREEKKDTPLQEKLNDLAEDIGKLGTWAAILMFVCLSIKELIQVYYFQTHALGIKKFLEMITCSITIVVVAVPEGLPLSVTIALAYSMRQMMAENNLVRHLAACETMGGATSICTDKTGTLTQNKMTVVRGTIGADVEYELTGDKTRDSEVVRSRIRVFSNDDYIKLVGESIALNTTAFKRSGPDGTLEYQGNKTEQALLVFLEKLGENPQAIRNHVHASDLHRYPFTSTKKTMTTMLRLSSRSGAAMLRQHTKGASEIVLERCQFLHNGNEVVPMTEDRRERLRTIITQMAMARLRTLCLAYADLPGRDEFEEREPNVVPPLTLLAVIGVEDPIRPEVEGAVAQCKRAGVAVRMVTGDNKTTAISIAKKAGIYGRVYWGEKAGEAGLALDGKTFREMAKSEAKLNIILPRLQVLARASPLDKQTLVEALMRRSEIVAVTGDGTNDAPALKNADVGFAMNTGTDVAKQASDVVILDDNFRSIVTAMKWGRNVNDNICKFIQFQTTVNVAAVFIAFVGSIMSGNGESPLKPVQLLWLNLIMDTMAALALATERPTDGLLHRQPRSRDAPLITRRMWTNIIGQAIYQICVLLWLLHFGFTWFGVDKDSEPHLTVIFNVFVLMQVFNEFNARKLDNSINAFSGLSQAPMFVAIIIVTLVVQVIAVAFAGPFMKTVPLSYEHWEKCLYLAVVPLPLGILLRLIPVVETEVPLRKDFVDEEEEVRERELYARRKRLTLRDAARRVITQLKVVGALSSMSNEGKM